MNTNIHTHTSTHHKHIDTQYYIIAKHTYTNTTMHNHVPYSLIIHPKFHPRHTSDSGASKYAPPSLAISDVHAQQQYYATWSATTISHI